MIVGGILIAIAVLFAAYLAATWAPERSLDESAEPLGPLPVHFP